MIKQVLKDIANRQTAFHNISPLIKMPLSRIMENVI